jgi:hypothetical protein
MAIVLANTGNVIRLSVRSGATFIRLDVSPDAVSPLDGYYELQLDNPNYNALYSLALAAAVNRLPLTIRVNDGKGDTEGIVKDKHGVVQYMNVNWAADQLDDK